MWEHSRNEVFALILCPAAFIPVASAFQVVSIFTLKLQESFFKNQIRWYNIVPLFLIIRTKNDISEHFIRKVYLISIKNFSLSPETEVKGKIIYEQGSSTLSNSWVRVFQVTFRLWFKSSSELRGCY